MSIIAVRKKITTLLILHIFSVFWHIYVLCHMVFRSILTRCEKFCIAPNYSCMPYLIPGIINIRLVRYDGLGIYKSRDYFVYGPNQWEMTLQCNAVSLWLGAYTNRSLQEVQVGPSSHKTSQMLPKMYLRITSIWLLDGFWEFYIKHCGTFTVWLLCFLY